MSPRKTLLFLLAVAAMAFGAVGASVASANGVSSHALRSHAATYRASKSLTYRGSGKPKLMVSVAANSGREITKVKVTLPKAFTWRTKALGRHLVVKGHKFTRAATAHAVTIKLKQAATKVTIIVKRGGIKQSKKARAAQATKGKVTLKVTERKVPTTSKTVTSTNALTKLLGQTSTNLTTIENTVLNQELTELENDLTGGASVTTLKSLPIIGDLLSTLGSNGSTSGIASELQSALSSLSGSGLSSLEGLAAVDNGLSSGISTLTGNLSELQTELVAAGVPKSLLAPVVTLVKQLGNGLPKTVVQLVSSLAASSPTDSTAALKDLQNALETNVSKYQKDLTTAVGSLVTGLTTLSSSNSSSALTGVITKLTSALQLSDSSSGVLGTGLSGLVSDLGLNLGSLLSGLGLGSTGLGGLGSLL